MPGDYRACLGSIDGGLCRVEDAVAFQCGDLHNRTAQTLGQGGDIDLVAVFADDVHHVDGHHHGDAQLHQLGG